MTSGVTPGNAKPERNQAIYNDRLAGMTIAKLAEKYQISEIRVNLIIKDVKMKRMLAEVRMGD